MWIPTHFAEYWLSRLFLFKTSILVWLLFLHRNTGFRWLFFSKLYIGLFTVRLLVLRIFITSDYVGSFHDNLNFILRLNNVGFFIDMDTSFKKHFLSECFYWLNLYQLSMVVKCDSWSDRGSFIETVTHVLRHCEFLRLSVLLRIVEYFFVDSFLTEIFS